MRKAIKNGTIINEDQATVPVTSRAVQYAYSIYESLRIKNGEFVHLEEHLERLRNSADGIKMDLEYTNGEIASWLHDLAEADGLVNETFRVLVVGDRPANVIITHFPTGTYPEEWYENGVAVSTYEGERFLPNYKTSNLLVSYLALTEAEEKGYFEALLINRHGYVTEEMGLEMVYEPVYEKDLFSFDSIFITSTGWKALPISSVNGKKVPMEAQDKVLELSRLIGEWE